MLKLASYRLRSKVVFGIVFLLLLLLPLPSLALAQKWIYIAMQVGIASISLLSFQWLMGRMGLLSFGHAVYIGLGSYATLYALQAVVQWPALAIIPVFVWPLFSALMVAGMAALIAYPSTLKTGLVFAMLSLTVSELIHIIAPAWPAFFGGESGISANRVYGNGFLGLNFGPQYQLYYVVLFYTLLAFYSLAYFNKAPIGIAMSAVKANPARAEALGWNAHKVRQIAFVIAGFWAGAAGGLQALLLEFVSIEALSSYQSGQILLFALLGGVNSVWGALTGALLWVMANSYLSHITAAWLFYLGILFMWVVLYQPAGLSAWLSSIKREDLNKTQVKKIIVNIVLIVIFIMTTEYLYFQISKGIDG